MMESALVHLERITSHRSNFQPIHLGGSFTEAPCKRHNRSLQLPRVTVRTSPPAFKTGPLPPRFLEGASLPLPHFVVFAFKKEACSPLPVVVFQFYGPARRMENRTG
ncbi:hypothetical protein AVEN_163923-1 [Araneus ventricosus]|uniref:Uncharacterized protein n=1 Tax=Araneus ventricosus TaxID=182803 RepID=A0A4Y2N8L5_ARAVE|nr:hypothetical protein AVEN_163923-1 [Araneus ventricosus]